MCDTMLPAVAPNTIVMERIHRTGRKLSPTRQDSTGANKLSPKQKRTNSFSKKGASKLMKSFSFNLKKSKRSLTPMRRSPSEASTDNSSLSEEVDSQSNSCSNEPIKSVHFNRNPNSKKIKKQVYEFPKVTEDEAKDYWYNEVDMMDMMEDVKHTVKQYLRKCERYRVAMDKIADKCASASDDKDSITAKLDPQVLLQIADAAARGVEHHVSPRQLFTRQDALEEILRYQDYSGSEETAQLMATKYASACKTARLIAKTMADGDALVAAQILKKDKAKTAAKQAAEVEA